MEPLPVRTIRTKQLASARIYILIIQCLRKKTDTNVKQGICTFTRTTQSVFPKAIVQITERLCTKRKRRALKEITIVRIFVDISTEGLAGTSA